MKILLYVYYFFRSVLLRGLINTVRLMMREIKGEKDFNIKTASIKKSDSSEFFHYQGASYLVLLKLFKNIFPLTKGFDFLDIGSGKGRAVFVAEYCGYNHLTGIELDNELVEMAHANVKTYAFKRKESELVFVNTNALDYKYKNSPTVYFLFNPFNEAVLKKVLEKIVSTTQSETWFIYMNPLHPAPFFEKKMQLVKKFKTRFYTEALIFKLN